MAWWRRRTSSPKVSFGPRRASGSSCGSEPSSSGASGSTDHHQLKGARAGSTEEKTARSPAATSRQAKKDSTANVQLNLFDFVAFLVRVAFWRANPQWGSKHNKKDLTPVPEATQILLEECILPKAMRDASGDALDELKNVVFVYEAHGLSTFHSHAFLSRVLAGDYNA